MVIYTAKVPKKRIKIGAVFCAVLLCCGAVFCLFPRGEKQTAAPQAVPSAKGISSAKDRLSYIAAWGWTVEQTPLAVQEFSIPAQMDESYDEYITLQQQQGFDLAAYAGKNVKRYTYEVTNYPSGEQGVQLNLLIYKKTVIAGEVLSGGINGFLHGLAMPEA